MFIKKFMKLFFLKTFILFIVLLSSFLFYFKITHIKSSETFLSVFDKKVFFAKQKNSSHWFDNQINEDFKDFTNGYSIEDINNLYRTIQKNLPKEKTNFIHYRIVNNKLYRYFPNDQKPALKGPAFERAVKTLTQVVKLPDLDFIYSDHDGTPLDFLPKDFYFTNTKNQAPLLNRAKIKEAKYIVLIPDYNQISSDWVRDSKMILDLVKSIPWENKKNTAFWRGTLHTNERLLIAYLSKKNPEFIDAGLTDTESSQMDIILKDNLRKPIASIKEHLEYKYLPVLDGFMCTYPGYQWRLLSNSIALKQESDQIQWFYIGLKPYVHYLPIKKDLSDLLEKVKWAISNDDECKKITQNANKFVKENLMIEDAYLYLYKVLIRYSKHQNFNKSTLIKNIKNDSNWLLIQNRKIANKKLLKKTYKL